VTQLFIDWLANITPDTCDALYILGDFFECWAGDDAVNASFHGPIVYALKRLSEAGVPVFVMHGNRDFLLGQQFSAKTGVKLLPDPCLISPYGQRILLTHGDALCTDDLSYIQFRQQVRQDNWQQAFLAQPLAQRNAYVQTARKASESAKTSKAMAIMDVNIEAVNRLLRRYDYPMYLIHGHTHRPGCHQHDNDSRTTLRWVLGDWYDQGSGLMLDAHGQLTVFPVGES